MSGQASTESFWVGKYEDIKNYPITADNMWSDGGQDITEDCVMADKADNWKWKRVACSASASHFCEPKKADCPDGYSSIGAIGDAKCFRNSGFATVDQNNNQVISSHTTANKICLDDGTRVAAPETDAERDALAKFVVSEDQILFGEGARSLTYLTGYWWFDQASIVPASCPTCSSLPDWQSGWISPWSDQLLADADLALTKYSGTKHGIEVVYNIDASTISSAQHQHIQVKKGSDDKRVTICEFRKCQGCVFPFIYAGRKYDTCISYGQADGSYWCSTEVDARGFHVEGKTQPCPSNCPQNNCPVGFRYHLKTCIQESASSPPDNPTSIDDAEKECLFQGGRLYQPRSTRSLNAAKVIIPRVYDGSKANDTVYGIHNWAIEGGIAEERAMGMMYNLTTSPASLMYKDGSAVPAGLVSAKLQWNTNYPTSDASDTCVTVQNLDKLSNNNCTMFTDKTSTALSYVCEARSDINTVDGPLEKPNKVCVFPFKIEAGGPWKHSCQYDPLPKNKWNIWCATKVDDQGVMIDGEQGNCEDERNTAYDGPDADNTCKLPFFYDGRWYENCTLYPRDNYWCATKVDPVTREMLNCELYNDFVLCNKSFIFS